MYGLGTIVAHQKIQMPSGCLLDFVPMDFQWHFPMEFHFCDFWCVIFFPRWVARRAESSGRGRPYRNETMLGHGQMGSHGRGSQTSSVLFTDTGIVRCIISITPHPAMSHDAVSCDAGWEQTASGDIWLRTNGVNTNAAAAKSNYV